MKKIICLLFSFAVSTFAIKAQTLTAVDMSQYGLPFTMEMPLSKPEQLKVTSEKNIIDETRSNYEITIDKGVAFGLSVSESKPGLSSAEEIIKGYKIAEAQETYYKFEKFIIDEPTFYLAQYKKGGSNTMFYDFVAMVKGSTKLYKFTSKSSKKYTEAQCKIMLDAIKSIKFK